MVQGYVNLGLLILGFVIGYFVGRKHGKKYNELVAKMDDLRKRISRIKKSFNSPKFGETYMVMDVPGRDRILFHLGNTKGDSI